MSEPYDLIVVGRPSVDIMFSGLHEWPRLGNDIDADGFGWCAGTSFNTPAAANRVGLHVGFVATVGNDVWSRMICNEFEAEGLPTDFLVVEDRPLPGVSVALNIAGDRGFVTHWRDDGAYAAELRARALEVVSQVEARHVHLYVDEMPEVVFAAKERGMTVSLDAWDGPRFDSPLQLPEMLAGADVFFANGAEATAIANVAAPTDAAATLAEHCPVVAVSLGAGGAIGRAGTDAQAVAADKVDVVDTTGAGDAFNAGFLRGWLRGLGLKTSLTLGVLCGTRAVGDYGGYRGVPHEDELRALARARGVDLPGS